MEKKLLNPNGLFKSMLSYQPLILVNLAINVYNILKQELLGRTNRLVSFDTRIVYKRKTLQRPDTQIAK
jgi:hypothetical protein